MGHLGYERALGRFFIRKKTIAAFMKNAAKAPPPTVPDKKY
jgi:hypothetical protein